MVIKIKAKNNTLKIKYKSNGKKYFKKITDEEEFDIDENSYFKVIKYDTNFDTKDKIILYSLKMIFLIIFLMIVDFCGYLSDGKSFYYVKYQFKCVSDSLIDGNDLENEKYTKKRTVESLFNTLYLILSFSLYGLIIFIICLCKSNK